VLQLIVGTLVCVVVRIVFVGLGSDPLLPAGLDLTRPADNLKWKVHLTLLELGSRKRDRPTGQALGESSQCESKAPDR
jgi:hypothetical protein